MGDLEAATQESITAAVEAGVLDPVLSAGPIAAILALAAKIDVWQQVVEYAKADAAEEKSNGNHTARPKVPEHDGTSHTTYLRMAESLNILPKKGAQPKAQEGSALEALRNNTTPNLRAVPDE